jgi:hypothetical protein
VCCHSCPDLVPLVFITGHLPCSRNRTLPRSRGLASMPLSGFFYLNPHLRNHPPRPWSCFALTPKDSLYAESTGSLLRAEFRYSISMSPQGTVQASGKHTTNVYRMKSAHLSGSLQAVCSYAPPQPTTPLGRSTVACCHGLWPLCYSHNSRSLTGSLGQTYLPHFQYVPFAFSTF